MARYTGPKDRLSRAVGFDLFGKGSKLTRINVPPGMHGNKRIRRSSSEYAKQLTEKQKVKRLYGILERQFSRYAERALRYKGNTGEQLLALLEKRLDNTIFRLGFTPNRISARQYVNHGHVLVNSKKVNIPSYQVRSGDVITLSPKAQDIPAVAKQLSNKDYKTPSWLERKGSAGKVTGNPGREDIHEPISEQDVVEFYSR
jgi:small subunit ribosomal protein S4